MIQPLRTAHRMTFVVMAMVLPAIVIVGLQARPNRQADSGDSSTTSSLALITRARASWNNHTLRTEFYLDRNPQQNVYIELLPARELNDPDLLLYWVPESVQNDLLPANAELVGNFVPGKGFPFQKRSGSLVLYSLGHGAIVDSAVVKGLP